MHKPLRTAPEESQGECVLCLVALQSKAEVHVKLGYRLCCGLVKLHMHQQARGTQHGHWTMETRFSGAVKTVLCKTVCNSVYKVL